MVGPGRAAHDCPWPEDKRPLGLWADAQGTGSRAQHPRSGHVIISCPVCPALGSRGSLDQKPGAPLDVRWTPHGHSAPATHRGHEENRPP